MMPMLRSNLPTVARRIVVLVIMILLAAGSPALLAQPEPLRLIVPNGGEYYSPGSQVTIAWSGAPAWDHNLDLTQVQISTDRGLTWQNIGTPVMDSTIVWTVPDIRTDQALIRVIHEVGSVGTARLVHTLTDARMPTSAKISAISRDGSLLVTRSDSAFGVWSLATGELRLHRNIGQKIVEVAAISRDNRLVAVASSNFGAPADSVFILIYDLATGGLTRRVHIQKVGGFDDMLLSLDFSPDGRKLAAATYSASAVWDVTTGRDVAWLHAADGSRNLLKAVYFGDDERIFVMNSKGFAVYGAGGGPPEHSVMTKARPQPGPGPGQAIGAENDSVKIWDLASGAVVRTYRPMGTDAKVIAQPGSERFLHQSKEWGVRIFHPLFDSWSGHLKRHAKVSEMMVAPGGEHFATIDSAKRVEVWHLPKRRDTSDGYITIASSTPSLAEVVVAPTRLRRDRDTLVEAFIHNPLDVPIEVTGMSLSGTHAREFSIDDNPERFTVPARSSGALRVRFHPADTGTRAATLMVSTTAGERSTTIRGVGVRGMLQFLGGARLEFGYVPIGETREKSVVMFRSVGPVGVTLDSLQVPEYIGYYMTIVGGGDMPVELEPGMTHELVVRFTPIDTRPINIFIKYFDDLGREYGYVLSGRGDSIPSAGTGERASARGSLGVLSVAPIPARDGIRLRLDRPLVDGGVLEILNGIGEIIERAPIEPAMPGEPVAHDVSALASGVYTLVVRSGEWAFATRFVIAR